MEESEQPSDLGKDSSQRPSSFAHAEGLSGSESSQPQPTIRPENKAGDEQEQNDSKLLYDFHIRRSQEYRQEQNWDMAISELRKAASIRPHHPDVSVNIGQVYERKGSQEGQRAFYIMAMDNFRTAVNLDPTLAAAHDGIIALAVKLGQIDELVQEYKNRLTKNPDDKILSDALNKLKAISLMSIPASEGPVQEKGCMSRLIINTMVPLIAIVLFLLGYFIRGYAPENFRFSGVAVPMMMSGSLLLVGYFFYKVLTHRGSQKRSQW